MSGRMGTDFRNQMKMLAGVAMQDVLEGLAAEYIEERDDGYVYDENDIRKVLVRVRRRVEEGVEWEAMAYSAISNGILTEENTEDLVDRLLAKLRLGGMAGWIVKRALMTSGVEAVRGVLMDVLLTDDG